LFYSSETDDYRAAAGVWGVDHKGDPVLIAPAPAGRPLHERPWMPGPALESARSGASAVLLSAMGTVLLVGGFNGQSYMATSEMLTPEPRAASILHKSPMRVREAMLAHLHTLPPVRVRAHAPDGDAAFMDANGARHGDLSGVSVVADHFEAAQGQSPQMVAASPVLGAKFAWPTARSSMDFNRGDVGEGRYFASFTDSLPAYLAREYTDDAVERMVRGGLVPAAEWRAGPYLRRCANHTLVLAHPYCDLEFIAGHVGPVPAMDEADDDQQGDDYDEEEAEAEVDVEAFSSKLAHALTEKPRAPHHQARYEDAASETGGEDSVSVAGDGAREAEEAEEEKKRDDDDDIIAHDASRSDDNVDNDSEVVQSEPESKQQVAKEGDAAPSDGQASDKHELVDSGDVDPIYADFNAYEGNYDLDADLLVDPSDVERAAEALVVPNHDNRAFMDDLDDLEHQS
jgi:hypothetical protein